MALFRSMTLGGATAPVAVALSTVAIALAASTGAAAASPCGEHPWCDPALSPDERTELLLEAMTLEEKLSLMGGDDPAGVVTGEPANGTSLGVPRLGIPTLYMNDGPAGLRKGKSTGLPAPIALASTFDPRLARRYGALIGDEAKHKGIHLNHAPAVNIARNPLGGRTFEYYGEDPLLTARLAVAFIRGQQRTGVISNVKHYAANNQETDRFVTNAIVNERTLREIYLPAFEAAVKRGGVGSVMIAYNRVNGERMTENEALVNGVLKQEWGFDGFALTDYGFAQSSTAEAANAGTDLEMPQAGWYSVPALSAAIAGGRVSVETIDEHAGRILRTMFRFETFDRAFPDPRNPDEAAIDVAAHGRLARRVAERGMVLLRNARLPAADRLARRAQRLLPLHARRIDSIAVIGAEADAYRNGGGSSNVTPYYSVTPYDGIAARAQRAGIETRLDDGSDHGRAAELAAAADVAVVVVNDNMTEFVDKTCLSLACGDPTSGDQDGLVSAVAAANPRTVVVAETGSPVLMPWAEAVPAILEAWYPGQEGGTAIARVLFGDVDPGGRLPISFPRNEGDTPTAGHPERYPGIAFDARYDEGVFVGYRHYDEHAIAPLFEFGHGLSYTRFRYRDLRVSRRRGQLTVRATIRNTGERRGIAAPQLYLGMPEPRTGVEQPPRALRGFKRVKLKPGRSRTVRFRLDRRALSYWDAPGDRWRVASGRYRVLVGASSRDIRLRGRFERRR